MATRVGSKVEWPADNLATRQQNTPDLGWHTHCTSSHHDIPASQELRPQTIVQWRMSVLGRFTLVSCLSVFVLALALSFVTSHLLTQYMLGWEWQHTAELVRYQVLAYSLERRFADSGLNKDRRLFKESLSSLLALPEVVRVKVWDKAGTVLWSDDESQIGRRFPDDDELQEALSGKTTIELGEVKQQNTDDRQEFRKLAEMYVPIPAERDPRRIAGVLEIYKSPMRPFGRIRTVRLVLWATSAAVASVPGAASV